MKLRRRQFLHLAAGAAVIPALSRVAFAQSVPIKVGFSMALTGSVAPNGKQLLIALEIWRDDVNAKGGLLGRPVELVYFDDQSNPSNVPAIYSKLLSVDKVDLILGPYATNMAAAAMPLIIDKGKTTISILAVGVSEQFDYPKYFSMLPAGPEGVITYSKGFFELASARTPRPNTVAILAADSEFAKSASDGARANAKALGFEVIYDKSYPPTTAEYSPMVRALKAANADIVFIAAYPPDTVGIVRAANDIGLSPKMFGGTMIGLLVTPIKVQLGPLIDGLIIAEPFVRAPTLTFPGLQDLLNKYGTRAKGQQIDPFGYGYAPFGYAAGQVLAKAVEESKSLDHDSIARYIHTHSFDTVVGTISFDKSGEWAQPRLLFTQFQNVDPNNLEQFSGTDREVVIWPHQYKTGDVIYPYSNAKKK